jgi:putative transcriptional regulator
LLLVAKPGLTDPNFRESVVLVSQTPDGSTVGVILNRATERKHETTGDPVNFGGPVMREVLVALYRAERQPEAAAFHVLRGVYLTMHPQNIEPLLKKESDRAQRSYRLFTGFAGWAPGQLESELARDDWFVLAASAELVFRKDTGGMWEELVRKARGRVAMR